MAVFGPLLYIPPGPFHTVVRVLVIAEIMDYLHGFGSGSGHKWPHGSVSESTKNTVPDP